MKRIPVDLLTYEILKYVSYFELNKVLSSFNLHNREITQIKQKIYANRLKIIKDTNSIKYYIENKLHRENDLPAIEYFDGTEYWMLNNKYHRNNGPAIITSNGTLEWWQHGVRHRNNGPAVTLANGLQLWFIY